ncbi:hypothetical protein GX586_12650 [bacterium]|nr:hypothetical protein [bacterium]
MSNDHSIASPTPLPLSGGESVYCFNEQQLAEARRLVEQDAASGPRLRAEIERLESSLSRNERAAIAFVIIDRLVKTPASDEGRP